MATKTDKNSRRTAAARGKGFRRRKSDNLVGRPKLPPEFVELRALARRHSTEAMKVVVAVMKDAKAPPSARLNAAAELLDLGWGGASAEADKDAFGRALADKLAHLGIGTDIANIDLEKLVAAIAEGGSSAMAVAMVIGYSIAETSWSSVVPSSEPKSHLDPTASPKPYDRAISNMGIEGSDIEAMAFIVLMQAMKDMESDLRMIMAEVKAMTAAKQKLRELISKVSKDVASNAEQADRRAPLGFHAGMGSQKAYHQARMPFPDPESEGGVRFVPTDLFRGEIVDVSQLVAVQEDLKGKLDSMNEMSETSSLRLQMFMDRRSRLLSTLSNIMKRTSATQDGLIQNLK